MTQSLEPKMGKILQFPSKDNPVKDKLSCSAYRNPYAQTEPLSERIERIRQSLEKINRLHAELKKNMAESNKNAE